MKKSWMKMVLGIVLHIVAIVLYAKAYYLTEADQLSTTWIQICVVTTAILLVAEMLVSSAIVSLFPRKWI